MPVLYSKKCNVPYKASTSTKKLFLLTSWWLLLSESNVFSGRILFVKAGFFLRTVCVIYDVYCVLKCNIPVFPLSW